MISGVRMMEPGTIERYAPARPWSKNGFGKCRPYAPRRETLDQAAERLAGVLDESVRLHAMADAPIGAFLSGGVDSTGIVGLMRQARRRFANLYPEVSRCARRGRSGSGHRGGRGLRLPAHGRRSHVARSGRSPAALCGRAGPTLGRRTEHLARLPRRGTRRKGRAVGYWRR